MRIGFFYVTVFISVFYLTACHSNSSPSTLPSDSTTNKMADTIPLYRKTVNKEAIAEWKERTDDPLNHWFFSVQLFETPRTFQYIIRMRFEEIEGEDTLKLPNLGKAPIPLLIKGKDKYSCIVGFMDPSNTFREFKLVHVIDGNKIKLTPLKHYYVVDYK